MMSRQLAAILVLGLPACLLPRLCAEDNASATLPMVVRGALQSAGDNKSEILAAIDRIPAEQRKGLFFLLEHMPKPDLESLDADFLLENLSYAYRAWNESPWKDSVSEDLFFNSVLPYASIDERRDRWRKEFHARFRPLIREAKTPGEAAVLLNQKIFPALKVHYSTKRRRANQGPHETIETGMASCTGLSILLIDACRAVGVPARFVGTPRWSDNSGNHSWVEVWDDGWHFTGAAEPAGDKLDQAWFVGRASKAQRDDRRHAIYALSFKRTPIKFPMVWSAGTNYIHAVNVTDRYTGTTEPLPEGFVWLRLRALDGSDRCAARVAIRDSSGKVVFEGQTKDERFDANDHETATVRKNEEYRVEIKKGGREISTTVRVGGDGRLVTVNLSEIKSKGSRISNEENSVGAERGTSLAAVQSLGEYLKTLRGDRAALKTQAFAEVALTRRDADRVQELLWNDQREWIRKSRADEMKAKRIKLGKLEMPFFYQVFGDKPEGGRSLYISMHGGGGAPARVNDRQWENQKRLYKIEEGVYLAPRAPTNAWNLWHQKHIDPMFDRLIENLIAFEDVDPNRIYILGYSAGGDGVFQLAPRMADRFAAAAMMAGHPNETVPLGLRNLPFTIQMGGKDSAYKRNRVAKSWGEELDRLQKTDPHGYVHWVEIHPEKGHWMDHEDAKALPWMARHVRKTLPERIVWKQDDVTHARFYWLAVRADEVKSRALIEADRKDQRIEIESKDAKRVFVRLNDRMLDLDKPVTIVSGDRELFQGLVPRTIDVITRTLLERGDPESVYRAEVEVELISGSKPSDSTASKSE